MNRQGTKKAAGGFTLIEVCIVTVISGLLFLSLFELYSQYSRTKARDDTWAHIQAASAEVSFFFNKQTRYPCPADRTLKSTDPNFGVEIGGNTATKKCDLLTAPYNIIPATPAARVGWLGSCYIPGVGVQAAGTNGVGGICAFPCWAGLPNPIGDLCGDKTGAANNVVVIGGYPFTTIRQVNGADYNGRAIMFDGWGNQLDYVVTYRLTSKSTYQFNYGAISVLDENGNDTAGITHNGHYGLISHGPDGIGAYNANGQMFEICGKHVPQNWGTGDDQNCMNQSMFIAGIRNDSHTAFHYDDIVYFTTKTSAGLWGQDGNNNLYNSNAGIVNVGTTNPPVDTTGNSLPNVALNVGNDVTAGTGNVHVDSTSVAKAATICRTKGNDCFNIKALTDPAGGTITCPAGMLVGIDSTAGVTTPHCVSMTGGVTFSKPPVGVVQKCQVGPPMQWMVGVSSDGKIICQ
jgi:Tfp pilus assembly protein PilE